MVMDDETYVRADFMQMPGNGFDVRDNRGVLYKSGILPLFEKDVVLVANQ